MKKIIKEIFIKFNVGVLIGLFLSIIFSLINNTDTLYFSAPIYYSQFSSKLLGDISAIIIFGIWGVLFYLSAFIFKLNISLFIKTFIHYIVVNVIIALSYFVLNIPKLDFYDFIIIFIIYLSIWIFNYYKTKRDVDLLNEKIKLKNKCY